MLIEDLLKLREATKPKKQLYKGVEIDVVDMQAVAAYVSAMNGCTDPLLDIAAAAIHVHQFEDSPLPNAQLLYDDAMFELGKAIQAWEEL
jgi:hypothetical protein